MIANQKQGKGFKVKNLSGLSSGQTVWPRLCSRRLCVLENNRNCLGIVRLSPATCRHQAILYKWAPAHCGQSDENSQLPHIYFTPCDPPGIISLLFVDTAVLLANDINRVWYLLYEQWPFLAKALGLERSKFTKCTHSKVDFLFNRLFVPNLPF